jgi:hypothetical protein
MILDRAASLQQPPTFAIIDQHREGTMESTAAMSGDLFLDPDDPIVLVDEQQLLDATLCHNVFNVALGSRYAKAGHRPSCV